MDFPRRRLTIVRGGRQDGPGATAPRARAQLRVVHGGQTAELEQALAEAVDAARQMRLEIERRIAAALEAFEDRG
jgi:hypothetical protein